MTSIELSAAPAAVEKYYAAQHTVKAGSLSDVFSSDMNFDGIMFKETGDTVQAFTEGFMEKHLDKYSLISITEVESARRYLVLHSVVIAGQEKELVVCDLVSVNAEGLICELQNTFNIEQAKSMLS